jgi:hypothetical protein
MRGPVIDYDQNGHAGGVVLGCFFPDDMARWCGRYLATGEEQGLTEGDSEVVDDTRRMAHHKAAALHHVVSMQGRFWASAWTEKISTSEACGSAHPWR